jgi:uncharacterized protein (DUF58 family)
MSLVLAPSDFRMLEGMRLAPRRSFHGRIRGERLTRKRGISIEFADYREYTEGDDLRHLDWNVLARLEHPVIKTYQDEEDLAVYILLDTSASMQFGEPPKSKLAREVAAALSYVALCGQDAVIPMSLGASRQQLATYRGRAAYARVCAWMEGLPEATDGMGLGRALRDFLKRNARPGFIALISDGLDPDAADQIRVLGGRGFEVNLLQILAPEEIDPDLEGDLRLLDAESGAAVELTANRDALRVYAENLTKHNAALEAACRRFGGRYERVRADLPLASLIRDHLRKGGWFQA